MRDRSLCPLRPLAHLTDAIVAADSAPRGIFSPRAWAVFAFDRSLASRPLTSWEDAHESPGRLEARYIHDVFEPRGREASSGAAGLVELEMHGADRR